MKFSDFQQPDLYAGRQSPTLASSESLESFAPIDLDAALSEDSTPIQPTLLRMTDHRCLLYHDRLNMIFGPSGDGKSWLIAFILVQLAEFGDRLLVVDTEDTVRPLIERARQLGLTDAQIRASLVFVNPQTSFYPTPEGDPVQLLANIVTTERCCHWFMDSLGEAFGLHGINENADAEVAPWLNAVARRLMQATGVGGTLIDHVTKADDIRLDPSGSKRKRAALTGAAWRTDAMEPFNRETGGAMKLTNAKDRMGNYRRGDHVANLLMRWDHGRCLMNLRPAEGAGQSPSERAEAEHWRLMCEVWDVVNLQPGMSQRALLAACRRANVSGSDERIKEVLEWGAHRDYLVVTPGARKALNYSAGHDPRRPVPTAAVQQ